MAARPTWKGYLKISLVNIPVKVFPATDAAASLSFNQLHAECQTRIQQKRWCPHCEREVANTDIVKGYEFEKGRYVVVDEEDIEKVRVDSTRVINLEKFTDDTAIDPIYLERPYYLAPDGPVARDAFAVIREGMKGKAGIGKVALYGREYLVKVQPRERGLVMYTMRHAAEIRSMDAIEELADMPDKVKPEEVKLARQVMGTFEGEVDFTSYKDDYQVGLREIIDAKIEGREIVAQEVEAPPKVVNLMEALRKSLDTISAKRKPAATVSRMIAPPKRRAGGRIVVAALLASLAWGVPAHAQMRGVTAEDYFAFETLGDPHFSPDGSTIAFVITTVDQKQNRRRTAIWSVPADGSREPMALTTAPQSSNNPRWSPDGKAIAFLSARPMPGDATADTPRQQVWLLPLGGGEPRRLTNLLNGASSFQWSPDGTKLAVVGRSGPSDAAKSGSDVRHYAHANYKFNDTGWFDDKRTHVWTVDVATGRSAQLTSGDDWNDTDPQWSPDSRRIAFVSDRSGRAFDESHDTDVWVIDASGGPLTKISDHKTGDTSPRWSPDGQTIAFLSSMPEKSHPKIWLASSAGGAPSRLAAEGVDLIPTALRWAEGGKALYFETGAKGTSQLYRVDLAARRAAAVTSGDRTVHLVDINEKTNRLAYAVNDPTHLDDLYVADLNARNEKPITHLNASLWKQLQLTPVERVAFKSADGWDIDGFFMRPVGWEAGKKYPMVLTIHGGPAGQFGFDWYHEFQVYASHGWAVFFTNPRGSTGYGERFERGIELNWGGKDYIDVMAGVDAALVKYPWIDKDRLGVTGGSYGGFMTNWIVGHTNRFKAAVTLRSISNFVSDDGTRDGAYGHADDFSGDIFEKFDLYWNASPLKYVKNVKTPTLVLHSDNDFRVPIEQGEQWFRALQHFGVPSEIVFFPRENHNLTRTGEPNHLVESINWQVYWFDKYLNGNTHAVPPDGPGRPATTRTQDRP